MMKKISLATAIILIIGLLFQTLTLADELMPTSGVFAKYEFGTSSESDIKTNMTCATLGTYAEYGLKLTPYKEVEDSIKGGTTKVKNTYTSSAAFDVTTAPQGGNDYLVEVEYLNIPEGFFYLRYTDESGKRVNTELLCCSVSGDMNKPIWDRISEVRGINETNAESQKHIFKLENADFSKANDFSIETIKNAKSARFEYGTQSVYIKNVTVYKEDKLPVKADVKSEKEGNIFYDRDLPEFDVCFFENAGTETEFDANFKVYKYDENKEARLISNFDSNVIEGKSILKGERFTKRFSINVSDYGLYMLEINITASGRTYTAATAEFSKCVGNDKQNDSLGVNVHSGTWDKGTMTNYMTLAKNAGFGVTREGVNWYSYEQSDGAFGVKNNEKGFYKICRDYGMEPYVIITPVNPSKCLDKRNNGIVDSAALDGVYNFVETLMDDPNMNDVTNFEIFNEPVLSIFYDEVEKKIKYTGTGKEERTQVYTAKGKAYGKVVEQAVKAIRAKRGNNAKIGILSLCGMDSKFDASGNRYIWNGMYIADNFIKGTLEYLRDPNEDGNYSDSVLNDVDVITYHPYSYNSNPEIANERLLSGVENIADEYGLNTQSAWHTEFGWSTATYPANAACIGNEFEQAKKIVRQYVSMYARNNSDKFIIYDLIDDDIITNTQESNYGVLHSELYPTPYAAKYSYLAVSNLNKMIEDTPNAKIVYDTVSDLYTGDYNTEINGYGTKGETVVEFSGDADKKVYMLWGIEDNKEAKYKITDDVIAYYDFLGNKVEPSEVETQSGYKVSSVPFYAVCGADTQKSVIDSGRNNVTITVEGKTDDEQSDKSVILIISDKDEISAKDIKSQNIIYSDFCKTKSNGYYRFNCGAVTDKSLVYTYIIEENGKESKFEIKPNRNTSELYLYKNMQAAENGSVSLNLVKDVSVIANLKNDVTKYPNVVLMIAFYKNAELKNVLTQKINDSYIEYKMPYLTDTECDAVKAFLWSSDGAVIPLCDSVYVK